MKAHRQPPLRFSQTHRCRAGISTLDSILVLGIILPLAAFVIPTGKHIIELVYEMITVLIAWPFM